MEPNESGLSSYYYHHHQLHNHLHQPQPQPQPQPPHHQHSPTGSAAGTTTTTASPTNGILPTTERAPQMAYPHSVASAVTPPSETVQRKRGRPRKYATPEQAAAAKRAPSSIPKKKKDHQSLGVAATTSSFPPPASSKKTQLPALGNAGQGFAPHIISVAAGEDVHQKIMLFMQQSKCEICILSASGSISNPSLRQPATFGGNITYDGQFDILSLSGSYIHTELGGRSGGLSVCLSSTDGQIIGGGISGPFNAAGPVEVIVGTFVIDTKKDTSISAKANSLTGN